jgi:type I restriction enzyme S subunit
VLRSTDIDDDGHVNLETGARRALSARERVAKALVPGDILLEASGGGPGKPVGRPAWFAGDDPNHYSASNFFKVLRADADQVDARFLLWKLLDLSHRPEIWHFQQQTTGIINLKFQDYLSARISAPPIPEQRRIAEILDSVDAEVRAIESTLTKLSSLRKGLLTEILIAQARTLDGVRVGVLEDFIADWLSGGTPSKANPRFWGGDVPWITPKDMKLDLLERTTDYLTERGALAGSRIAPSGAVFVVVRGMILAHTFPVSRFISSAAFNQDVKALIPTPELLPEYLKYWLIANSDTFLRLVGESTHGTKKLDLPDLKAVPATIPSIADQRHTLSVLQEMDERVFVESRQLRKLRLRRSGLMADLLSGRVRVSREATV